MDNGQKGFIVYGDNEPLFDRLTDEEAGQLLKAMVKYFNNGNEPEFDSLLTDVVWIQIKLQMDRNAEKYKKKCEKNRESIQSYWDKVKQDTNEYERIRTNTNATDRDKDRDRDTKKERDTESVPDASSLSSELVSYLNEKTGSTYEATDKITERVASLIESGYSPEQLRTVIDKKCSEWLNDDKMRTYLRPSTLFGDKFSEYLAAPITLAQEREQDTERKRKSLASELEQKRDTLGMLKASLDEIPRGTRMDERRGLKDQIAALEDSIDLIERRLS